MTTNRADACPDAETLAAWSEHGLTPTERRAIDAHVAGCARCLAHVAALARSEPTVDRARVSTWISWRWLVPAAAGVAALGLWLAVQPRSPRVAEPAPPSAPAARSAKAESPPPSPAAPLSSTVASPAPAEGRAAASPPPALAESRAQAPRDALTTAAPSQRADAASAGARANEARDARSAQSPTTSENVAPAPAAAPEPFAQAALRRPDASAVAIEIASSDPSVRWRIRTTTVERTTDGGATWLAQPTGASQPLTAGASPSADVCWIVGRRGTVLRSVDGVRSWQTVAFPDQADLVRVTATGASTATVATSDARRFTTEDGGATWKAGGLQDF